jgi:hypothetical protein
MNRSALLLAALFAAFLPTAIAQKGRCPGIETNILDSRFKPGQVWTYQPRPGEASSTLTILQVDRLEKTGIVIHIRVDGLQAHNPQGELVPSVLHMPFARDAMLLSVVHLLRTEPSIPTLDGYENWRAACGGVYTISVADAVNVMEKTLNAP